MKVRSARYYERFNEADDDERPILQPAQNLCMHVQSLRGIQVMHTTCRRRTSARGKNTHLDCLDSVGGGK